MANGVSAFFHGHDHEYAYEVRDNIVYQEMPAGRFFRNRIQLTIVRAVILKKFYPAVVTFELQLHPSLATVDYVYSTTNNGSVAYSYTILPYQLPILTLYLTAFIEGYTNTDGTAMNYPPTVTVELHNVTTPYALVESQTGSLSTAGVGTFNFTTAVNGIPYYIVVKSANTVETWSATAVSFTSGAASYDFTSAQAQAYGNNLKQVISGAKWCIYSGDVDQNGFVDVSDLNAVNNDAYNLVTGSVVTDLTGNSFVDVSDLLIANNNSHNLIESHTPIKGNPAASIIKPIIRHLSVQKNAQ